MEEKDKLDKIISILTTIKGWIIFMGITTILSICTWLFIAFYVVKDIENTNKQDTWKKRLKEN
jgi:hypothetical protein